MLFTNIHVLKPNGVILKNAYVAVDGKYITFVGTEKPSQFTGHIYDGKDKLLIPGFINTHCHVPMTLLRGLGADLPLDRWLNEAIFPIEAKLCGSFDYWGALLGIGEMIRCGVTSFNDMYYYGPNTAQAVLESGIKANLSLGIVSFDENAPVQQAREFQSSKYLFENYHNQEDGRLKIDMCIHAEYTSHPRVVSAVADYAKEVGALMQIHLSETEKETKECIQRHGKTPAAYFQDLGLFENKTTAAHCVWLTAEDMDILAKNHVTVAHCPISNMKLGSGIADITKMTEKGITISIGTDGVASNDNLNFLEDMKMTALLQKGYHQNPALMPVGTILDMATINGAISQSRPDTGKIEAGFRADLAVVDFHMPNMQPALDMANGLIYAATPDNVCLTMADGKILYENGQYFTIDMEKIIYNVKKITKKLYPGQ